MTRVNRPNIVCVIQCVAKVKVVSTPFFFKFRFIPTLPLNASMPESADNKQVQPVPQFFQTKLFSMNPVCLVVLQFCTIIFVTCHVMNLHVM